MVYADAGAAERSEIPTQVGYLFYGGGGPGHLKPKPREIPLGYSTKLAAPKISPSGAPAHDKHILWGTKKLRT